MSQRVPYKNSVVSSFKGEDHFSDLTMYNTSGEWNNVEIKPFKNSVYDLQLDALNCGGVPTRTTPTLTPTTLKNIEQMFIELQSEAESHQNEAGFVPPLLQPTSSAATTVVPVPTSSSSHAAGVTNSANNSIFMSMVDTKSWQGGSTTVTDVPAASAEHSNPNNNTLPATIPTHVISVVNNSAANRRNIGGRRPNKENGISPEEEERRKLRRERNKLAAARCRKRRLDHTNELLEETEELEGKKQRLQDEIHQLQVQKEELEFLLEAHKPCCRLRYMESPEDDIKPFLLDRSSPSTSSPILNIIKTEAESADSDSSIQSTNVPKVPVSGNSINTNSGRVRPNSLPVINTFIPKTVNKIAVPVSDVNDIPISTPSAGLSLNFDSLLMGGTGLSPLSSSVTSFVPSCATQQRNSNCLDLISPDTVPSKLVSL